MSLETRSEIVVVDCDLDEAPDKVWRALTTPELMAVWLAPGNVRPEVGHRFELAPEGAGPVECEVTEAEPGERLALAWRERDEAGGLIESEVTFVLTPTISGGTRLRVVHDGFVRAGVTVSAMASIPAALRRRRWTPQGGLAWAA